MEKKLICRLVGGRDYSIAIITDLPVQMLQVLVIFLGILGSFVADVEATEEYDGAELED